MSESKKVEVEPSIAFCGMPPSATELCIGALPAATFRTEMENENRYVGENPLLLVLRSIIWTTQYQLGIAHRQLVERALFAIEDAFVAKYQTVVDISLDVILVRHNDACSKAKDSEQS